MSLRFFLSSVYAVCQIALGLLMHPYQTLQTVAQERIFLWMSLFPSFLLVFLVANWRWWLRAFLEFWFECYPHFPVLCQVADVSALWMTFFCIYWQVLVGYLTFRFVVAFRKGNYGSR